LDGSVTPTLSGTELVEEPTQIEIGISGENGSLEKRPEGLKAEALLSGDNITEHELEVLDGEEKEEFDYLAYAQDRAMFFWGDMVALGLVRREELPEELVRRLKVVEY
jgi:choline kinase